MKIVQVMPDFGLAGAETMVENLSCGLAAEGCDVLVISFFDLHTAITERIENRGIKIKYLGKKRGFDPSIISKMRKIIKAYQPDVIHTHRYVLPYAFLASMGFKAKRVHTVHNVAQKEQTKVGKNINRVLFRYFNVVPVALSKEIQRTIQEVYGLPDNRIPVVFNGIDLSRCIVKESYARKDTFTVLHIGRFMDVKNHELLLRSFARFKGQHSDARLQLLGDGELKENMMQLAGQLNITDAVEFAGLQSNVYPWLHNADVFILPSKFEGMPMTLIEAMGTGLPIIASNVGGIPDMLSSQKEALLIEPKEEKIIEALEMVYSDAKKREYWGRNALQRSSLFSSQAMARKYLQLYSSGR
jgi:glycosyltransferase involved in cell wall biosynthesis